MAKYRKVDPRIWNDAKFMALSDQGKLAFFFLLTHPHMTAIGAMRATIPGLAAEIGWELKAFTKAFQEVSRKGMAEHDERACFLWLPNFIKYNKPENPNVVKAWGSALDMLPECMLKTRVIKGAKDFVEGFNEAFTKALPEAFRIPLPIQEQEQEQEQEQDKDLMAHPLDDANTDDDSSPKQSRNNYPPSFERLWDMYPERSGGNPKRKAFHAWNARIEAGVNPGIMQTGLLRYIEFLRATGRTGTEFVLQASTFFGPDERFMDDWTPPKQHSSSGGKQQQLEVRNKTAIERAAETRRRNLVNEPKSIN